MEYRELNGVRSKLFAAIIPILAVLGILTCIELSWIYYNANFVADSAPSFCNINNYINCDAVARSSYSTFLGVPLSLYGLGFYVFALIFSTVLRSRIKNYKSYIFSASLFSITISLILYFVSTRIINKLCVLCFVTYFINFLIVIASGIGMSPIQHLKNTFNGFMAFLSNQTYRIIFMLFIIVVLVAFIAINQLHLFRPTINADEPFGSYKASQDTQYTNVLGDKNPKLIIREYTDFECPYCSMSNSMLHRLVKEVKGVAVIHYDFPMGEDCNRFVTGNPHKYSCTAALYSIASKKQMKMVQFNSLLFENQQNLNEAEILKLAKSINLDVKKLKKDAYSPANKKELQENIDTGIELGVTGTPTYFIGVKKYEGYIPYSEMKAIVKSNMPE